MSRTKHSTKRIKAVAATEGIKVPSMLVRAMKLRGGAGVHADQRKRADPHVLRRDRSYKEKEHWN